MSIRRLVGIAIAATMLSAQAPAPKYTAGQVWEYHTRQQDTGSLLKIQQIGTLGSETVYHISIVGVRFAQPTIAGILPHIPVSETTLNASVTRLSSARTDFPTTAWQEGLAQWTRDKGGVFTISVSQIITIVDDQIADSMNKPAEKPGAS